MYNGPELLGITSRLSASIQAAAAEQLTSVLSENRGAKGKQENPEAALMDAVKNNSKLANKFYSAYASWLRDYIDKAPDIPEKERQRSIFWVNQLINCDLSGKLFLDKSIRRSEVCANKRGEHDKRLRELA